MKKLLCVILASCMIFALTACNSEPDAAPAATANEAANENKDADNEETTPAIETDEPAADEPAADEPAADEPAADEPAAEEETDVLDYSYDDSRLLYKEDFENGIGQWQARQIGDAVEHSDYKKILEKYGTTFITMEQTDETAYSGNYSLKVADRYAGWNGAILDITDYLSDEIDSYEAMVWVKMPEDCDPARLILSYQTNVEEFGFDVEDYAYWNDYAGESGVYSKYMLPAGTEDPGKDENLTPFYTYPEGYSTDDGWVLLRGTMQIVKSSYDKISVYIETTQGNATKQNFYIDDFVLLKGK